MSQQHRIIITPANKSLDGMRLFTFPINAPLLLGISENLSELYQIVQLNGPESTTNSWFIHDYVVEDGRLYGMVQMLKGWLFFNLFSKSKLARSVYLTIENLLCSDNSEGEDSSTDDSELLQSIYRSNLGEIEKFLCKFMPNQVDLEGCTAFKYDQEFIANQLKVVIKDLLVSTITPADVLSDPYFDLKWSEADDKCAALLLENFQMFLPAALFPLLCSKFGFSPTAEDEIRKRLKVESMTLKPISSSSSSSSTSTKPFDAENIAPTSDYSKFIPSTAKAAASKAKNIRPANNSSITSFFQSK